nr:hypothetical protein [Tanacetum cinerariifolium]
EAIRREDNKDREAVLSKELAELGTQRDELKAKWEGEKSVLTNIQTEKENIERFKTEAEQAERQGDYGRVAELRYGKIQEAEQKLKALQDEANANKDGGGMLQEVVTSEDIAEAEAIAAISDAVRRSRAGLQDPKRPIGSFIFLGTTGVGKTELAKALAEYLFNDENAMVRIDMSEFQERHAVSRLIGAPPGYPLKRKEIRKIVDIQFKQIQQRLQEAGISLEATDEVLDYLGEQGFDPQFGARPLKRVLQRVILNELSKEILSGKVSKDAVVEAVLEDGAVTRLVMPIATGAATKPPIRMARLPPSTLLPSMLGLARARVMDKMPARPR